MMSFTLVVVKDIKMNRYEPIERDVHSYSMNHDIFQREEIKERNLPDEILLLQMMAFHLYKPELHIGDNTYETSWFCFPMKFSGVILLQVLAFHLLGH